MGLFLNEDVGKRQDEKEFVWIVEIPDITKFLDELKVSDSSSLMEQWELKTVHGSPGKNGTVRVRAIDNKEFILGTKVYGDITKETEIKVTKDVFDDFKSLAPMGSIKKRFNFPIRGTSLKWEIDVYYDQSKRPVNWAKIDLEVPNSYKESDVPPFPISVGEVIPRQRDSRQEKLSTKIFKELFTVYNSDNILPLEQR